MSRLVRPGIPALFAAVLAVAAGCGDDSTPNPAGPTLGALVPDFSVRDVNPNSPRHDEMVSPRNYAGHVSAWYFGDAT